MTDRYICYFFLFIFVSSLTACALPPIPLPTDDTAIIKLSTQPGRSLIAQTLDHKQVFDGRYFQVNEGKHKLTVLFQYDASEIAGPFRRNGSSATCLISFYREFATGESYRLEARPILNGAQLLLSTGHKVILLNFSNTDVSCGPY